MSTIPDGRFPDAHHDQHSRTIFGFWLYILTDFILFGALFAVYAVLKKSVFGGTPAHELFHLPYNLWQSLILLVSATTIGAGGIYAHRNEMSKTVFFFIITFVLGSIFIGMEFAEFSRLIASGNSWENSAFLSAYFTLVGTHGGHICFGLLWIILLMIQVLREGITPVTLTRLTCMRMFWQFLNIIWIFIFTVVYLMGEIQ